MLHTVHPDGPPGDLCQHHTQRRPGDSPAKLVSFNQATVADSNVPDRKRPRIHCTHCKARRIAPRRLRGQRQ
eukprot:6042973-Prymnesium_polylepis.1